ncbi:hypothetical protein GYMLUDRAFT_257458 [Collybiopsis luxurians FD-317 M1]|nr:hypothetical protein GYMLUDRAFT_257458 [Collybiopsis luxurians FD-317 M1]
MFMPFKPRVKVDTVVINERLRSCYGVTASQVSEVQEILELSKQDRADYEKEMNRLQSVYKTELERLRAVYEQDLHSMRIRQRGLEKYTSTISTLLSPIRRLPNELLSYIFILFCGVNDLTGNRPGSRSALTVSAVCYRWREFAISQPVLWTSITIHCKEYEEILDVQAENALARQVELYLARSCNKLLSLDLIPRPPYADRPVLLALARESRRWEHLLYRDDKFGTYQIPCFQSLSLPELRTVYFMSSDACSGEVIPEGAFSLAPKIKTLGFESMCIEEVLGVFSWDGITELDYTISYPDLEIFAVLEQCTKLRRLSLVADDPHSDIPKAELSSGTLSELSVLQIQDSFHALDYAMSNLTLPHLVKLTVSAGQKVTPNPFPVLNDFFTRSQCRLTSLTLKRLAFTDAQIVSLLLCLPCLVDLSCEDPNRTDCRPISTPFIKSLHSWERSGLHFLTQPLVPKLSSLVLKVESFSFDSCSFVDTIASRWLPDQASEAQIGVSCLRSVELHLPKDMDGVPFEQLRQFDKAGMRIVVKCRGNTRDMVRLTVIPYIALLSLLRASIAAGIPARRSMAVHDARTLPVYFASSGTPNHSEPINLKIALTAQDTTGLEQKLHEVSDPTSPLYGQHLSYEETKAFAGPTSDSVDAVTAWLNENGITNITTTGAFDDWLAFTVPISTANLLFNADYQQYTEIGGPTQLTRTLAYSIPVDLKDHINVLLPSTDFVRNLQTPGFRIPAPVPSNNTARTIAPPSCPLVITPACLQALYGIPATKATQTSNVLGVSGFHSQGPQRLDLRAFLTILRPDIPPNTTYTLETIDGGSNPQGSSDAAGEGNYDIQYTVGVATGVPVTFINVGPNTTDGIDGFLDMMDYLNAQTSPPHVLTTSAGLSEPEVTSVLAKYEIFSVASLYTDEGEFFRQLCNAYMAAGARGISVLFGSGDSGVGPGSQNCTSFTPIFPASCPFVTSVGATTNFTAETSASFSGGGFSDIFAQPSYQSTAVSSYLSALGSTYSGKFNSTGRAFPDVAAQGQNVGYINAGQQTLFTGTSASTPIFASIIALINDRLVATGKSPLGFLNPFLYANPGAFFDITTGSNPGWDPVTGLGTPNFANLLAAAGV